MSRRDYIRRSAGLNEATVKHDVDNNLLPDCVREGTALRGLDFSRNRINDEGVRYILRKMELEGITADCVYFYACGITDTAVEEISLLIPRWGNQSRARRSLNYPIDQIHISHNSGITIAGLRMLLRQTLSVSDLYPQKYKQRYYPLYLRVNDCAIEKGQIDELVSELCSSGTVSRGFFRVIADTHEENCRWYEKYSADHPKVHIIMRSSELSEVIDASTGDLRIGYPHCHRTPAILDMFDDEEARAVVMPLAKRIMRNLPGILRTVESNSEWHLDVWVNSYHRRLLYMIIGGHLRDIRPSGEFELRGVDICVSSNSKLGRIHLCLTSKFFSNCSEPFLTCRKRFEKCLDISDKIQQISLRNLSFKKLDYVSRFLFFMKIP